MIMSWLRIEAGKVVAAIRLRKGKVIETAPVFSFMMGWSRPEVEEYCREEKWAVRALPYE